MNDNKDFNAPLNNEDNVVKEDKVEDNDVIAKNFPDWDLLPPYQTVRRINRK